MISSVLFEREVPEEPAARSEELRVQHTRDVGAQERHRPAAGAARQVSRDVVSRDVTSQTTRLATRPGKRARRCPWPRPESSWRRRDGK